MFQITLKLRAMQRLLSLAVLRVGWAIPASSSLGAHPVVVRWWLGLKLPEGWAGLQIQDSFVNDMFDAFILWGSKISVDGDCSHEIKRLLLLGRKVMTNLDSILKRRDDITLLIKVFLVKTMVFPVVMDGCESWAIKKAEH